MKKNGKQNRKKQKSSAPAPAATPAKMTRRQMIGYLQYGVIGAVVFGGVGTYAATSVMASVREQDLSVIGTGLPAIVQIHDPACQQCTILQREARAALGDIDDAQVAYRVANLTSTDGQDFARQHGVGRVSIMLFNSNGQPVDVLSGPRTRDALATRFQTLIDTDG